MRPRNWARPALEVLEDRLVLDAGTWIGGGMNVDWANAANWYWTSGTQHAPQTGDDVKFENAIGGGNNVDCKFSGPALELNSLTIASSYTKTLTLGASLTIDSKFEMDGGNIVQLAGANSSLAIDGKGTWNDGSINATGAVSVLEVMEHGTMDIGKTASLSLGDNLIVDGGTVNGTLFIYSGIAFNANCGIDNSGSVTLYGQTFLSGGTSNLTAPSGSHGLFRNEAGATFAYVGQGSTDTSDLPIVNYGTITVSSWLANQTSLFKVTRASPDSGYSMVQFDGELDITQGHTLTLAAGYHQWGGYLDTVGGSAAYLNGSVTIDGGTVEFNQGGVGVLKVAGNVQFNYGTLAVTIDGNTLNYGGLIATGSITLNTAGDVVLDVDTINVPPGGIPDGTQFAVLTAGQNQTLTGDFAEIVFDGGWTNYTESIGNFRPNTPAYILTAHNP